jgi:hypothetical protein
MIIINWEKVNTNGLDILLNDQKMLLAQTTLGEKRGFQLIALNNALLSPMNSGTYSTEPFQLGGILLWVNSSHRKK